MSALSLNRGKPVSAREVTEMKARHAEGQSIHYIATAMGRSWTTVNRYAKGLANWIETRNPQISPETHREYFRLKRREREFRRRLHEVLSAAQEYL